MERLILYIYNEEIYRRPETKIIDKNFDIIIDAFKKDKSLKDSVISKKTNLDDKFRREITDIITSIFKLFNARIILRFDDNSSFNVLSFGKQ